MGWESEELLQTESEEFDWQGSEMRPGQFEEWVVLLTETPSQFVGTRDDPQPLLERNPCIS